MRTDRLLIGSISIISGAVIVFLYNRRRNGRNLSCKKSNVNNQDLRFIEDELYSRAISFFGPSEFLAIKKSFVIVVGLGGVGSHATNMLIRSGVQEIRLIDFDQVTLSSLNRHAFANLEDVGVPKVHAVARHISRIAPWIKVEPLATMFRGVDAAGLLDGKPNFVLDCIDDVNTKSDLISYCIKQDIKVITSMGAGGKADPTRIRIGTLNDCIKDPLSTKIKWKLKKHGVSASAVNTIFSVEKPRCNLLPLTEEQSAAPQDYGTVDYMRLRVMPVLGTSPAIFGQAMASFVLCNLAGAPFSPDPCDRMSRSFKQRILQSFQANEARRFSEENYFESDVDEDDVEFVIHQVWHGRCAVSEKRIGGHIPMSLIRWNPTEPPTPYNLVLLTTSVANRIETENITDIPSEALKFIEDRLCWARNTYAASWDEKEIHRLARGKLTLKSESHIGGNTITMSHYFFNFRNLFTWW